MERPTNIAPATLSGKIAVIVGGSGGIGAATARMLADEGATVVITWRKGETAAAAVIASLVGTDTAHTMQMSATRHPSTRWRRR
jgi:NAD(P)-dependent dehydrogenase (short-subunit alcohol dehydrogenase family)